MTTRRLDRFTRVRLAPQSDCSMLTNARWTEGDRDIAVSGGVWDFDNVNQPANRWIVPKPGPSPKIFEFEKVEGLTLRGITFRNPVWYNCQLRCVSHFTVEDITFVQDKWNPKPINMDGINIQGGSHHGRVANLRGTCFDDMVALNADDPRAPYGRLPITDIDVDGLYSDFTHRGVRIYSCCRQPVKRVTVRNVHIRTYRNAVGITNFRPNEGPGVFDDIVIRDIQSSVTHEPDDGYHDPVAWPLVWVEGNCEVGHLVIDNLSRTETWRAAHPTIGIDPKATVEHLAISNCRQVNETKDDMVFLVNRGKVANLELGTVSLKSVPGAGRNVLRDDTAACGRIFPNFTPNVRSKEK